MDPVRSGELRDGEITADPMQISGVSLETPARNEIHFQHTIFRPDTRPKARPCIAFADC